MTVVRRGDGRVAGTYEQCAFGPTDPDDRPRALLGAVAGLHVGGMVGRPGRLGFSDLRSLASGDRLSDFDASRVGFVDILARVRVHADAQVVVIGAPDGATLAFRLDSVLGPDDAVLELGAERPDGQRDWRGPITLHGTVLPSGSTFEVARISFVTYADFVLGAWRDASTS